METSKIEPSNNVILAKAARPDITGLFLGRALASDPRGGSELLIDAAGMVHL